MFSKAKIGHELQAGLTYLSKNSAFFFSAVNLVTFLICGFFNTKYNTHLDLPN